MTVDNDFFTLKTGNFTIEGLTRAGHESYFRLRELGIALDIGRGPDLLISVPHVFVTHAHLDHSAGIPFYAGQRRMQRMPPGRIYVPAESLDDFRALMVIHERLEGTGYDVELIGLSPLETVSISRSLKVRAHQATHRIPSRAYEIIQMRHHLKQEFAGKPGQELASLRAAGVTVHDEAEVSILFYTGDTDRGILEANQALYGADVLMIECSFVSDGHQERAREYRHIHFDDLVDVADRFENRIILLTHFSLRYRYEEIMAVLNRRCPAALRDRIRLAFPPPWQRLAAI